ncbi:MAG: hypothetical protein ACR2M1_05005 [Gemmatimonadaceae bacterium]
MNAFLLWGAIEFGGIAGWTARILFTIIDGLAIRDLIQQRSSHNSPASPRSI